MSEQQNRSLPLAARDESVPGDTRRTIRQTSSRRRGSGARFAEEVIRVDPTGGDVHVQLSRGADRATLFLQVSPAGHSKNALARTPFGDVSYTRFSGLNERTAAELARRYAALLESGKLPLPSRYPHLLGEKAAPDQLVRLLGLASVTPHSEVQLDPSGLCALLAPEIVPDGAPFAGHVLRAIHWLPDRQACLLQLTTAEAGGEPLDLVIGAASRLSESFAGAKALAIEMGRGNENLSDAQGHFAARLTALLVLKQAAHFECRLPDPTPLASVPPERTPIEGALETPLPPREFPDLHTFVEMLLSLGVLRSTAGLASNAGDSHATEELAAKIGTERRRFEQCTAETIRSEWETLTRESLLLEGVAPPRLAMPQDYGDAVIVAATLERMVSDSGRSSALEDMYADSIPRKWLCQLVVRSSPNVQLLHSAFDWERLPRLRRMIESLFAQINAAGGSATTYLGAPTAAEFFASANTIAELYEGSYWSRFMPLQDASPADLAAIGRFLDGDTAPEAVVDRLLSPPLFHDLTHGRNTRVALFPPNLDECITAYIGVRAAPDLLLPEPGEANGLQVIGWYSQVGQALARVVGWEQLVRAYTGVETWSAVLSPELIRAIVRLGWEDYFHHRHESFQPRVYRPDAWLKLFFLAQAGFDLESFDMPRLEALPWTEIPTDEPKPLDTEIVRDGVRAMCVNHFLDGEWMRVGRRLPGEPIAIDLTACRMSTGSAPGSADPVPPAYLFPPAIAARLRDDGIVSLSVRLHAATAIPEVVANVVEGRSANDPAFSVEIHSRRVGSA